MTVPYDRREYDPLLFEEDAERLGGYVYTVSRQFSSLHANRRINDAILAATNFHDKKVIDIGCGDGTYTFDFFVRGRPSELVGTDPAQAAVAIAQDRYGKHGIRFYDHSIYALPFPDGYFDIAVLRGMLHHLDRPAAGVKEAVRIAKEIVITEPNGYNLGLKIIERVSPYHRRHREVSYPPSEHARWLRDAGATAIKDSFILLVPIFLPDAPAKLLARLEPYAERSRAVAQFMCGTHVILAANTRYQYEFPV